MNALYDGRETQFARIAAAILADPELMEPRAKMGANTVIAAEFGVKPSYVANIRYLLRYGRGPRGRLVDRRVKLQPGCLSERLLELDRAQPGLSRAQQAELLGTTTRTIRDCVYALRRDGYPISQPVHCTGNAGLPKRAKQRFDHDQKSKGR